MSRFIWGADVSNDRSHGGQPLFIENCSQETEERKWASCSTTGSFSFNDELLVKPGRKEVIIHEVLHMKALNHGKLFKALLRAYLR